MSTLSPGQRRWLRRLPAAVVALALVALLARNADTPSFPDYEVPEGFTPSPPPTAPVAGGALPQLAAVRGTTTTTVPDNVGRARVVGLVTGPDGPVPGAVVRLERVVGGVTQVLDVAAGPDGRYEAAGIGGGRYRVRAFLPPTLAQPSGEVLYLRHDEERAVDLVVSSFGDPVVAVAVAPESPSVGDAVNIAVRVSGRLVDGDGVVRSQPLVGATVSVSSTGGWGTPSPAAAVTGGDGQARFASTCRAPAPSQLLVTVRPPAALPGVAGTTAAFDVPACAAPAPTTSTTSGGQAPTSSSTPSTPTTGG